MTSRKLKTGKRHKLYKMRGCSSKNKCKHLGGASTNNMMDSTPAKYNPYNPNTGPLPNPYIALPGSMKKGGCDSCGKLWGGNGGSNGGSNGLTTFVGSSWTPTNLPSHNNANHYALNTYTKGDVQLDTKVLGANPPFLKGGRRMRKSSKSNLKRNLKTKTKRNNQKGGVFSNSLYQDFVNLGRSMSFSSGSTYNTLIGTGAPVNPLPWQGQLASKIH